MRLIDADALTKNEYLIDENGTVYGKRVYVTFEEIENAPTIELEQKKGKWVKCESLYFSRFNSSQLYNPYRCTVCLKTNDEKTKYCPNCGAKMEEAENDERRSK